VIDGTSFAHKGAQPDDAVGCLVLFAIDAILVKGVASHLSLKELG